MPSCFEIVSVEFPVARQRGQMLTVVLRQVFNLTGFWLVTADGT
jgi:hypothetical protein